MELMVEFAGLARMHTRVPRFTMQLEQGTTFRQILGMLGDRYPELVGDVISPGLDSLRSSNMLNLNGKHMIQPSQMNQCPAKGDRLILMSILAGG
ncbi:MAG: MoaD/ThiS family protein [Anaerolineae bacterium]|nr:MoaD/ThiS family protein [Anaerolineae bacterium]